MRPRMRPLAAGLALLVATAAQADEERVWTPVYLPRYATLGMETSYNQSGTLSPVARVGWAGTAIDQRTNLLVLFELGAAYSLSLPDGATDLYQYTAMVGA